MKKLGKDWIPLTSLVSSHQLKDGKTITTESIGYIRGNYYNERYLWVNIGGQRFGIAVKKLKQVIKEHEAWWRQVKGEKKTGAKKVRFNCSAAIYRVVE